MEGYGATAMKAAEPARKQDGPRLPFEIESLAKGIAEARSVVAMLAERLESVMVPFPERDDERALDSVPTREPSTLTRSIIACREDVRRITQQANGLLEQLEI